MKKKKKKHTNQSKYHIRNSNLNCQNDNDSNSDNNNSANKTSKLCYFSAFDYFVLASTLAIALGEELSDNDIDILSTFLAVLSDQLALIGNVNSCSQNQQDNIFVPPIPAVSSSASRSSNSSSRKRSKKIVKRKVKKK